MVSNMKEGFLGDGLKHGGSLRDGLKYGGSLGDGLKNGGWGGLKRLRYDTT